jgi:uncharacterized membrane protein YgaE (UPF0421/DUF939 family)
MDVARLRGTLDRSVAAAQQHPRIPLAVKTAVAAAAAWIVVQPMDGIADRYPYYAPLGAVVAMSTSVVSSVRASVQGVLAIFLGAALALVATQLPVPELAALTLVVAVGTLLAGWSRIGSMASWVPISALFILIIGAKDPVDYAVAYLVLTGLGAAIAVAINAAVPPLPLTPATITSTALLTTLAEQLEDLAEALTQDPIPTPAEWEKRQREIAPQAEYLRGLVNDAAEARRVNWRAHRWVEMTERVYAQARALQQLAFLVEDITAVLVDREHAERETVALGPALRPPAAEALGRMAEVLRSVDGSTASPEALEAADAAVRDLVATIREQRHETGDDFFDAGTIVTAARRAISALVPADEADRLPTA